MMLLPVLIGACSFRRTGSHFAGTCAGVRVGNKDRPYSRGNASMRIRAMADGFSLTFATYMTPWTQDCMFFVVVTLSEAGIAVAPDPKKRGFGMEEQWFAPW